MPLHAAVGRISVNGALLFDSSKKLSARQNGQGKFDEAVGQPNSALNHSRSPLMLMMIPFRKDALPDVPLANLTKESAISSHSLAHVVWSAPCFGITASRNSEQATFLDVIMQRKLRTCSESTSLYGAASPCRTHGIGKSCSQSSESKNSAFRRNCLLSHRCCDQNFLKSPGEAVKLSSRPDLR